MAEKVDVYFPVFVGDYLKDTGDLTAEEHGAYLLLLMRLWTSDGYLPDDASRLARLSCVAPKRWPVVWGAIGRFFDVFDGRISQKRLLAELVRAKDKKRRASDRGAAGAVARWSKDAHANGTSNGTSIAQAKPEAMLADGSSSSSSPSENPIPPKPPRGGGDEPSERDDPDFNAAWDAFPRRRGTRHKAYQRWKRLKPRPSLERVLACIARDKASHDWRKENGEYIPAMSAWLAGEPWKDWIEGVPPPPTNPAPPSRPLFTGAEPR